MTCSRLGRRAGQLAEAKIRCRFYEVGLKRLDERHPDAEIGRIFGPGGEFEQMVASELVLESIEQQPVRWIRNEEATSRPEREGRAGHAPLHTERYNARLTLHACHIHAGSPKVGMIRW